MAEDGGRPAHPRTRSPPVDVGECRRSPLPTPPPVNRRAARPKVGFGFDVRRYLLGAVRPEFLADGLLREVLGFSAREWATATHGLAHDQALRVWTGEAWCRLFLDGQPVGEV